MESLTANESFNKFYFWTWKIYWGPDLGGLIAGYGPEHDQCNLIPEAIDSYEPILFKESKSYSMIV